MGTWGLKLQAYNAALEEKLRNADPFELRLLPAFARLTYAGIYNVTACVYKKVTIATDVFSWFFILHLSTINTKGHRQNCRNKSTQNTIRLCLSNVSQSLSIAAHVRACPLFHVAN